MRIIRYLCLALGAFLVVGCNTKQAGTGTNYYLDAEKGNDANTGLSKEQAWKSLDRANA